MKWPSPFLRKIGTYFSVVAKIRENAPDKANDLRLVSRDPQKLWVPKGYFESYYVAVLQALISLDQLRKELYYFKGWGSFFVLFFWMVRLFSEPVA